MPRQTPDSNDRFTLTAAAIAGPTPHAAILGIAQRLSEIDVGVLAWHVQRRSRASASDDNCISDATAGRLVQLLRFLILNIGITPTWPLDDLWRAALLFPALYAQLSCAICGPEVVDGNSDTLIDRDCGIPIPPLLIHPYLLPITKAIYYYYYYLYLRYYCYFIIVVGYYRINWTSKGFLSATNAGYIGIPHFSL
ncbi:hypothetical protein BDR26DRAFT_900912 [Obelidium mucronatum]|nr:hypothetical protein BDR26DRAFT_900912 [Obelidium mucronatum]